MSLRRWWVAAGATAREVLRGRFVLILLVLVPAAFYAVGWLTGTDEPLPFRLGSIGEGVDLVVPQRHEITVFIGLAATGLLTSFVGLKLAQRDVESVRRLVLCGFRAPELLGARLFVLVAVIGAVAAGLGSVVPLLFFAPERTGAMIVAFAAGGWISGCWGLLVGALIRKELEGILVVALLTNLDAGWLQNPVWYAGAQNRELIRALPMHFPSQAAMAAAFSTEPIGRPLLLGGAYGAALLALAMVAYGWRLRVRR